MFYIALLYFWVKEFCFEIHIEDDLKEVVGKKVDDRYFTGSKIRL